MCPLHRFWESAPCYPQSYTWGVEPSGLACAARVKSLLFESIKATDAWRSQGLVSEKTAVAHPPPPVPLLWPLVPRCGCSSPRKGQSSAVSAQPQRPHHSRSHVLKAPTHRCSGAQILAAIACSNLRRISDLPLLICKP